MKFASEVLFILLLVFNFYFAANRKLNFTVVTLILYFFSADYFFYMLGYNIGEFSVGKLYVELVFMIVFSFFILDVSFRNLKFNSFDVIMCLFLFFSLALLFFGFLMNSLTSAINGWRSLFLFIFLAWGITYFTTDNVRLLKLIVKTVVTVAIINSFVSIYEYHTFTGDFSIVWRYNLLLEAKTIKDNNFDEHFLQYQLIRGDMLRASGLFASALSSGFFTSFAAILITNSLLNNRKFKVLLFSVLFLLLYSMFTSQVRTAFVIYFLALALSVVFKGKALNYRAFFIYVLTIPIVIFIIGLLSQSLLDASSAGRILQYQYLLAHISLFGEGLGANVGKFDSFYIYSFVDLGLMACALLGLFISWFRYFPLRQGRTFILEAKGYPMLQMSFVVFFPILAVQHVASSLYYFSIVLFALLICKSNKDTLQTMKKGYTL